MKITIKIFNFFIILSTIILFSLINTFLQNIKKLPNYNKLKYYNPSQITKIYTSDLYLIDEYSQQKRIYSKIKDIPQNIINTFTSSEDQSFFENSGIDIKSIFASCLDVIQKKRVRGASTITQQVVKNLLLTHDRTIDRKIKEIILAHIISKKFSKKEILEVYLNHIYFGQGIYGINAASQHYFDKKMQELKLEEISFLASIIPLPSKYCLPQNFTKVIKIRNSILYRMHQKGYINREKYKNTKNTPIILKKQKKKYIKCNHVAEKIKKIAIKKFGEDMFFNGGLTIVSTINSTYQNQANKSLIDGINDYHKREGYKTVICNLNNLDNWQKKLITIQAQNNNFNSEIAVILKINNSKCLIGCIDGVTHLLSKEGKVGHKVNPQFLKKGDVINITNINNNYTLNNIKANGAILALDHKTGQVLAMSGGIEGNIFDRATQAKRQIGSLVKMFVYLAAIENNIDLDTILTDEEITIEQPHNQTSWTPQNYGNKFMGPVSMREAFEKSINIITVKTGMQIGLSKICSLIEKFNIKVNNSNLSLLLGAIETTLEEITCAYATIANYGQKIEPHFIEYVQDSNGNFIFKRREEITLDEDLKNLNQIINIKKEQNTKQIVNKKDAYKMISLMEGVVNNGTGRKLKQIPNVLAAKTGTTNNSNDVWCVAFDPNITVSSYVGYDIPQSLGKKIVGANTALPIIKTFLEKVLKNKPPIPFLNPK